MKDFLLTVKQNDKIASNIYKIVLACTEKLPVIKGGQFLHIAVPGFTLRRPFGIADFNENTVTVIYAVVGEGTAALSRIAVGQALPCILPIGNGFCNSYKKILLLGGGMGAAPLLSVMVEQPEKEYHVFYGFSSDKTVILEQESAKYAKNICIATDDGSYGQKGRITTFVQEQIHTIQPDAVFACGPLPMFKALKTINFNNIPVFISLEERMGCGVGACLVCACPIQKGTVIANKRVCIDGPVFDLMEVVL